MGHISASRFDQSRRRALVLASPCSTYLTLEGAWGRGRQGIDLLSPWGGGGVVICYQEDAHKRPRPRPCEQRT